MDTMAEKAKALIAESRIGVLATVGDEYPLASLMFYALDNGPTEIILGTRRGTAKFGNLDEWPSVTFIIDRRARALESLERGESVTVFGRALPLLPGDPGFDENLEKYLDRNPELEEFAAVDDFAIVRIHAVKYEYVHGVDSVQWFQTADLAG